jgi:outer membrane protein TolC
MPIDTLKKYAKLRDALISEKATIEARLNQLNEVLGSESSQPTPPAPTPTVTTGATMTLKEAVIQALQSRGPLKRRELAAAVLEAGYPSSPKRVLSGLGNVLYGKNSPVKKRYGKYCLP